MQFYIRSSGIELTDALRSHAERRLRFALDRARDAIRTVRMTLSDVNGPRGGRDKRCIVRVCLPRHREVVVEDTDVSLQVAIDRAVGRLEQRIVRLLARQKDFPFIAAHTLTGEIARADH